MKHPAKKKICYLVSDSNSGGTATSTKTIVDGINHEKYHVTVVAAGEGEISSVISEHSDKFVSLGTGPFPKVRKLIDGKVKEDFASWPELLKWLLKTTYKFTKWLIKEKIDLVHTNSIHFNLISGAACKLANIRSVWHVRTPQTRSWRRGGPFLVEGYLAAWLASCFIANSNFTRQTFHRSWAKKSVVVHNAVDVSFIRQHSKKGGLRALADIPKGNKLVGVIGVISQRKGLDRFIQLAGRITSLKKDVNFVIIGDAFNDIDASTKAELVETTRKLGMENKIFFTGELKNAGCYACDLDAFFMCSLPGTETFGLVVVEAMAAGVPVVAFNNDAMPEIIEHKKTGFLVEEGDVASAVDVVLRILEDKKLSDNLAENSVNRAEKMFDFPGLINSIEKTYDRMLS